MNQAGSPPHRERLRMVVLAAVSLVVYTAAVSSVPIETWRRLPGRPALHDITIAVGITALVLIPSAAFLDALLTSIRDTPGDAPSPGILSYIDALRTTLLTTVVLIVIDVVAVAETNPVSVRADDAAIILIAGSTLATAGSRTLDTIARRQLTGALRRLVGWCGVVSWPTYHLATQRPPSVIASVLYLAVVATWATATRRRPHNVRP